MRFPSVRVFLLEKSHKIAALSNQLARIGCRAWTVPRESDDQNAYAGSCDPDDQVLEIAGHNLDWTGLVQFAKQRDIEFCVVCGAGFRGIRLDYCHALPFEHVPACPDEWC